MSDAIKQMVSNIICDDFHDLCNKTNGFQHNLWWSSWVYAIKCNKTNGFQRFTIDLLIYVRICDMFIIGGKGRDGKGERKGDIDKERTGKAMKQAEKQQQETCHVAHCAEMWSRLWESYENLMRNLWESDEKDIETHVPADLGRTKQMKKNKKRRKTY